jgi:hypothetical protein
MALRHSLINPRRFETFRGNTIRNVGILLPTDHKKKILSRFALETTKFAFLSLSHFTHQLTSLWAAVLCLLGETKLEAATLKPL